MAYTLQFAKSTTLSASMTISETTSATLSSAVFTNFTGDYLVLDYDNPSKAEVIKCTVTGTAISSITRNQDGTSAIAHSAGAKVGYMFVPAQYTALTDGSGLQTGSGSVGVPVTAIKQTAWTSYTPTVSQGASTDIAKTVSNSVYTRIGNTVIYTFRLSMTGTGSAGSSVVLTLPVTARYGTTYTAGCGEYFDTGSDSYTIRLQVSTTTSLTMSPANITTVGASIGANPNIAVASGDVISGTVTYEAA